MNGVAPLARIIYEDDELRVIAQDGQGELLLVTFADLVSLADGLRFFGAVPAAKAGLPAIGFVAKTPKWYPATNVRAAIAAIADRLAPYRHRLAYGGSMGGYAALKFSRALGVTHVIALCPQWSIDPEECGGFESGWSNFFLPQMAGLGIQSHEVIDNAFVFSDLGDTVDRFHCRRISEVAPKTCVISVPTIGHYVTAVFAGTDNLRELIEASIKNDVAGLRRFARRTRRAHPIRFKLLMAKAYPRHRRLCLNYVLAAARERPQVLDADPRFLHDALEETMRVAGRQAMLDFVQRYQACTDSPPRQLRAAFLAALRLSSRACVKTCHNTLIVYDYASDACWHAVETRHGAEAPVDFQLDGTEAAFSVEVTGTRLVLRPDDDGQLSCIGRPEIDPASGIFRVEPVSGGGFQLSLDGLYLSAEPGGRLVCNRSTASTWEQFHFGVVEPV